MNKIIYEGKTKFVYQGEKEDEVVVSYKDDAIAFGGVKKAIIKNKGILNSQISARLFKYLETQGIDTDYIDKVDDRQTLCKKTRPILIEFVCRNRVAGRMASSLGLEEGMVLKRPVLELSYKNDKLRDPMINDCHVLALNLISEEELAYTYQQILKINDILVELFKKIDINLVDFKIEFGFDKNGKIILIDEFSPDSARLWDAKTNQKYDKDVFSRDLGSVKDTYQIVLDRLIKLGI